MTLSNTIRILDDFWDSLQILIEFESTLLLNVRLFSFSHTHRNAFVSAIQNSFISTENKSLMLRMSWFTAFFRCCCCCCLSEYHSVAYVSYWQDVKFSQTCSLQYFFAWFSHEWNETDLFTSAILYIKYLHIQWNRVDKNKGKNSNKKSDTMNMSRSERGVQPSPTHKKIGQSSFYNQRISLTQSQLYTKTGNAVILLKMKWKLQENSLWKSPCMNFVDVYFCGSYVFVISFIHCIFTYFGLIHLLCK